MTAGAAVGVHHAASSSPVAGDQRHESPPDPESGVDWPARMVAAPDATAVGVGFTVTVTVGALVEGWPAASVTVSVYVVVTFGLAAGVHDDASSRPVAGAHEQPAPPEPASGVEAPSQIVAEPEATAVGGAGPAEGVKVRA